MVTALGSCVKWPSFTVFPFGPFGLDLEPWRYVFGKTKGLSVKCCHISNQKVYTLLRYKIPHKQVPTFLEWLPVKEDSPLRKYTIRQVTVAGKFFNVAYMIRLFEDFEDMDVCVCVYVFYLFIFIY